MGLLNRIRERLITRAYRQIRLGIAAGEVIYNFSVKNNNEAARQALVQASKTPRKSYEATMHIVAKRMGCNPAEDML